jgi:DNA-binding CsgD family transcriptional regulator
MIASPTQDADPSDRPDVVVDGQVPPVLSCTRFVRRPPDAHEVLVLAHVAAGFTDGQIGQVLGISLGKVRWASRSVIAKLGAANRPHAVTRAVAMGYLRVTDRGVMPSVRKDRT